MGAKLSAVLDGSTPSRRDRRIQPRNGADQGLTGFTLALEFGHLEPGFHFVPKGTRDSSPAIYRRVGHQILTLNLSGRPDS